MPPDPQMGSERLPFKCPTCGKQYSVQEEYAGKRTACPSCQTRFVVPASPRLTKTTVLETANASALVGVADTAPIVRPNKGWRYLSSPWLVMILLFGFLPWSEVSCNNTEIRLSQSGYQALYGGISCPL